MRRVEGGGAVVNGMDGYHEAKRVREDKRLEGKCVMDRDLPARDRDQGPSERPAADCSRQDEEQ